MFATSLFLAALLTPEADVRATIDAYVKATINYDAVALDNMLDKDYLEVSPLGELDLRPAVIGFYKVPVDQRGPTPKFFSVEEFSVRFPARNVAVAVYREDIEIERQAKTMKLSMRGTTVLVQRHGHWLLYSNHFNGVRKPAK